MELAKEYELDLVEIAPTANPPVCRIMDFSKYKYDQEKKERKARRSQKVTHLKQIRMKPFIDDHDYETKMKQIRGFLADKDKVRVNMFFRGREMSHKELGRQILDRVVTDTAGVGLPEKAPMLEGRIMSVVLTPVGGENKPKVVEQDM